MTMIKAVKKNATNELDISAIKALVISSDQLLLRSSWNIKAIA